MKKTLLYLICDSYNYNTTCQPFTLNTALGIRTFNTN